MELHHNESYDQGREAENDLIPSHLIGHGYLTDIEKK